MSASNALVPRRSIGYGIALAAACCLAPRLQVQHLGQHAVVERRRIDDQQRSLPILRRQSGLFDQCGDLRLEQVRRIDLREAGHIDDAVDGLAKQRRDPRRVLGDEVWEKLSRSIAFLVVRVIITAGADNYERFSIHHFSRARLAVEQAVGHHGDR